MIEELRKIVLPRTVRTELSEEPFKKVEQSVNRPVKKEGPVKKVEKPVKKEIPFKKAIVIVGITPIKSSAIPEVTNDNIIPADFSEGTFSQSEKYSPPTINDVAAKVLPPMTVVYVNGIIENIDSSIRVKCPRGHEHLYKNADVLKKSPACKTCSVKGIITKKIREQLEDILGIPLRLTVSSKVHFTYEGSLSSRSIIVHTVKSGNTVEEKGIIIPESQSKQLINESIVKQCKHIELPQSARDKINALIPKVESKTAPRLPYSCDFSDSELNYRIIPGNSLYIEKCGYFLSEGKDAK